jgi:hypothetical protein
MTSPCLHQSEVKGLVSMQDTNQGGEPLAGHVGALSASSLYQFCQTYSQNAPAIFYQRICLLLDGLTSDARQVVVSGLGQVV